jgi:hypothetical protein
MASELAQKVRELRQSLDALDETRAQIQAELDEIVAAAGGAPERPKGRSKGRSVAAGRRPIREGSALHWAKVVLEKRGTPWYVDDLLKDIQHLSGRTIQKTSLVSSLSRYVRAGDTFTRPKEGYYGLVTHEHETEAQGA